jgi:hypothetical protein
MIAEKSAIDFLGMFYEPRTRDENLQEEKSIKNVVITINQMCIIIISTYMFGLIWYRLSDYGFKHWLLPSEPEERHWVVTWGLKRPSCDEDLGELMALYDRLIVSMYFMLTTLSTVGYGDYYPTSISEKIVGALI